MPARAEREALLRKSFSNKHRRGDVLAGLNNTRQRDFVTVKANIINFYCELCLQEQKRAAHFRNRFHTMVRYSGQNEPYGQVRTLPRRCFFGFTIYLYEQTRCTYMVGSNALMDRRGTPVGC